MDGFEPDVLIVDGPHMLHRAIHVPSKRLATRGGTRTGGSFGVTLMLRERVRDNPTARRCIVFWDGGRSRRRQALRPEYKAGRDLDPAHPKYAEQIETRRLYQSQLALLDRLLRPLGVQQITVDGREADDAIAVCAWRVAEAGGRALVVTGDKDLYQLVADDASIAVCSPTSTSPYQLVSAETFEAVCEVPCRLWLLYRALVGDSSDGLKGLVGVGPKTALSVCRAVADRWEEPFPWDAGALRRLLSTVVQVTQNLVHSDRRGARRYRKVLEQLPRLAIAVSVQDIYQEVLTFSAEELALAEANGTPPRLDEGGLLAVCQELEFGSVVQTWSKWIEPFRRLG
jgi:5'-3' exonuclease